MLIWLASAALATCTVTDGDTIRCGAERIRLLAIDAPEKPGHCRRGRTCAPGNAEASTRSLVAAMAEGPLTIRRFGLDRYGRTLATVRAGGVDLSCWQLTRGMAIYKPKWDNQRTVAATCPSASSRYTAERQEHQAERWTWGRGPGLIRRAA